VEDAAAAGECTGAVVAAVGIVVGMPAVAVVVVVASIAGTAGAADIAVVTQRTAVVEIGSGS